MQQQFSPADGTLGVTLGLKEKLVADADLFWGLVFLETPQTLNVVRRVETQANTFSAVASGTSGLLIVSLKALGDVVMYDETHIGFVDAHTESDRSHDDLYFLHEESVLVGCSGLRIHAGMISARRYTIDMQYFR